MLLRNWLRARDRLRQDLGRTPTASEFITCEELARKQLAIFRKVLQDSSKKPGELPYVSLDATFTCSMNDTIRVFQAKACCSPNHILDCLATLDKPNQLVLMLRFGLLGEAPMSLMETSERMKIDVQTVLQHEAAALETLLTSVSAPVASA